MSLKAIYLFLLPIFSLTNLHLSAERIEATSAYKYIRNYQVSANGYTTSKSGTDLVVRDDLTLINGYSTSSTIDINGSNKTNVFIAITKNNTTLDLNHQSIKANDSGHIAIAIADNVSEVTIKNGIIESGTSNFDSAIIIGQNTAKITFENLTIIECAHADGAIKATGTSSEKVESLTLNNVQFIRNQKQALSCSYGTNVKLNNLICSSHTSTSALNVIDFQNSNNIEGNNIGVNNNSGTSGSIGINLNTSNNVFLQNIFISNNTDSSGEVHTEGIKIESSNNVTITHADINNLTKSKYGISSIASKNIDLSYIKINNCHSGTSQPFTAFYMQNSKVIQANEMTISNNTGTTDCTGIKCDTAINKSVTLTNINIAANNALSGIFTGIGIQNTNQIHIESCSISQNTATNNVYGIRASASTNKCFFKDTEVNNNSSSSTSTGTVVAGFHFYGTHELELYQCTAAGNNGTGQAFGYYLSNLNYARLNECNGFGNNAAIGVADLLPSAGLCLLTCNHCLVQNSSYIGNRGGNHAPGSGTAVVNIATSCGGHGIVNLGTDASTLNEGNQFINCTCTGNGTEHGLTEPSSSHYEYTTGPSAYHYYASEAVASGAADQWTKNSSFENCTFNNNGTSDYVLSMGLLSISASKKTQIKNCISNNNGFYGFVDYGVFESPQQNAETFFLGCLAISNGSDNSIATTVESDTYLRNCRIYYTTGLGTETPPFLDTKFNSFAELLTEQNPYVNISIRETS